MCRRFVVAALVLLAGCVRGETRTLDDVLTSARERFFSLRSSAPAAPVREAIGVLEKDLDIVAQGSEGTGLATKSAAIAEALAKLSVHAGYTTRPALAELTNQYRYLSQTAAREGSLGPQAKLLVARTYLLMASELETTGFGVN